MSARRSSAAREGAEVRQIREYRPCMTKNEIGRAIGRPIDGRITSHTRARIAEPIGRIYAFYGRTPTHGARPEVADTTGGHETHVANENGSRTRLHLVGPTSIGKATLGRPILRRK